MQAADRYFISKCLEGDHAAFGFLVDKYKAALYAFAYSRIHNFHDAEDITQKTFLKAYQNLRNLRHYDSFPAWLYSIASSHCKMHIRSQSRRPDKEYIEDQDDEELKYASMELHREDMVYDSLHDALDSLPEKYQEVLALYYLGGMDGKEIAEFLGISYSNVKQRLFRARMLLKEEMTNLMETRLQEQRLGASFTFRIVETAKRIRINPTPKTASLPWGMASAISIIIAAFILNPYMPLNILAAHKGWPLPVETKVLKAGEIPVDIMEISNVSVISSKNGDGNSGELIMSIQDDEPSNTQTEGGKWTRKADMQIARLWFSTCEVDGKIYAISGEVDISINTAVLEVYYPKSDKWERKANVPMAKHGIAACAVNGKIYVIGGLSYNDDILSVVEEYDPKTDKWAKKADMPTKRCFLSASQINGKIYAIGGFPVNSILAFLPTVEEYDPKTDRWTKKADMPTPRAILSTCVVGDKIYAIGGTNQYNGTNDFSGLPTVEEYDPETDTWTKKSDMLMPRVHLTASALNGKIYAIGGGDRFIPARPIEEYDPKTDTWKKLGDIPTPRGGLSSIVVDGKIYAIGGYNFDDDFLSTVEEFDPGFLKKAD